MFYQASDKGPAGVYESRATLKPQGGGSAKQEGVKAGAAEQSPIREAESKAQVQRRRNREVMESKALVAITVTWHKPEAKAESMWRGVFRKRRSSCVFIPPLVSYDPAKVFIEHNTDIFLVNDLFQNKFLLLIRDLKQLFLTINNLKFDLFDLK